MKKLMHKDGCACGVHKVEIHEEHCEHEKCECKDEKHHQHSNMMKEVKYKFRVEGIDCANCASKIEEAIAKENNITEVYLNFANKTILLNTQLKEKDVLDKINNVASNVEDGVSISLFSDEERGEKSNIIDILQLVIGVILLVIALYFEDKVPFNPIYMFLVTYLIAGYKVILTALRNLLKGELFDENFLMSIATIGAFVVGSFEEAVAVMLFFDLGELFQSFAVNRSRKSIRNLMEIKNEYATILKDGKEIQIDPKLIEVGNLIVVRAGERIVVDGIVNEGTTSLDVSMLSGESLPKDIQIGDEVLSGSLNISGLFTMKATKKMEESTLSRVLELVENASSKKAPIEKFITKFSKIYTPSVVLAAILIVFIPTLLQGFSTFDTWLYRGCTFLVISCPCALVISIPLGLFAGIGASGKKGVLIKGGNYLELLSDMDTIIFDKTGTITKGVFEVQSINGSDDLLEIAAYGESNSNHPIAKSIVNKYSKTLDKNKLSDYKELSGYGISALYNGKELLVGNAKLLVENKIAFKENTTLGSIVYVAYNYEYKGNIVISDTLKDTSVEAVQQLKAMGIKQSVMLTGDKKEVADKIANEVGVDIVHSQLLPQDKVRILESYLSSDHKVAFVGDGINDAPVLMRADIGIAMGGIGSDAAIEASDIVLMNDDLLAITAAIKIAKKTKSILKQNIIFSLVIKFGVLGLTAFGLVNMWMGVFADVGVTLIAITNAMRAMYTK